MSENRSEDECIFERIESIMIRGVKFPRNIFLSKVCQ